MTTLLKAALLHYWRFKRRSIVATEVTMGMGIGDVVVFTNTKRCVEIEVKISVNDLYKETGRKKAKHIYYDECENKYVPNKFYFCVPKSILKKTEEIVERLNPLYGILVYEDNRRKALKNRISVFRKASPICKLEHAYIREAIINRLNSEICQVYEKRSKKCLDSKKVVII